MTDFTARRTMMVDTQVRPSDVTKFPIIDAMLSVPRERYVPTGREEAAYIGENLELAPGRVLLEPRTFAKMLDALVLHPEDVVLDIGCGLGYSAAVIARMVSAVIAVEDAPDRVAEAESLLADGDADNVAVIAGPLVDGAPQHGPYDAIVVEGGVGQVPDAVLAQLKPGGRIACVFMDGALGTVRIGHAHDAGVDWRFAFNASAPILPGFETKAAFIL